MSPVFIVWLRHADGAWSARIEAPDAEQAGQLALAAGPPGWRVVGVKQWHPGDERPRSWIEAGRPWGR